MDLTKRVVIQLLFLFFLCYSLQIKAQSIQFMDGITIDSKDGTKLSANVYLPKDTQHTWPLIIMPNSWNLDEYEYSFPAQAFAKKGYVVLSYSARGWGKSEGRVNLASSDDLEDIDAIIAWATHELPIDTQHIGMAGISYGGGLSLLAATHDPRIKAVAVMSAWTDLESAFNNNNSPSNLMGSLLVQSGKMVGRLDPEIETNFQHLVQHIHYDETKQWAQARSPQHFIEGINRNQTAVYISQNLGDRLFKPNALLHFFADVTAPKRMDLNQGVHGSAEAPGLFGFDNYVWSQADKWFERWLKGVDNGIDKAPILSIEAKKGQRIVADQWPIDVIVKKYNLQKRANLFSPGELTTHEVVTTSSNTLHFGLVTGVNSGIPIVSPILESHADLPIITWLPGINPLNAIYYQTEPVRQNKTILGIPHVTLWYKPSSQKSQLIAYLYDVNPYGMGQLISHGPVSRYHDIPGNYVVSEFDLAMSVHQIAKGHRLALAIGTYDVLYSPPTTQDYTMQIAYGQSMASSITIPFANQSIADIPH
jgi:putative CocE/NonD family hydrolase